MDHFDAIVLGMGPGGEVPASRLLAAGQKSAVVERKLIGGECVYWACIPSKTLLPPTEASAGARRSAGVDGATLDSPTASSSPPARDPFVPRKDIVGAGTPPR
jgi:pyruvate/2-oxoglutarate dehydrogenase complex dihydrolipoamide dehydrogenase (E3) component